MTCVIHGYFEGYCDLCRIETEDDNQDLVTACEDEDD